MGQMRRPLRRPRPICLAGAKAPLPDMRSKPVRRFGAGRLKAADLIEFLGKHAAAKPGPGKARASGSSGAGDSDEAAGGDGSEKAVPKVRPSQNRVVRVALVNRD